MHASGHAHYLHLVAPRLCLTLVSNGQKIRSASGARKRWARHHHRNWPQSDLCFSSKSRFTSFIIDDELPHHSHHTGPVSPCSLVGMHNTATSCCCPGLSLHSTTQRTLHKGTKRQADAGVTTKQALSSLSHCLADISAALAWVLRKRPGCTCSKLGVLGRDHACLTAAAPGLPCTVSHLSRSAASCSVGIIGGLGI